MVQPGVDYWNIPKKWVGQDAIIVLSGPSIKGLDLSCYSKHNMIVVNSAWTAAPQSDYAIHCDKTWWMASGAALREAKELGNFDGEIITFQHTREAGYKCIKRNVIEGISTQPDTVRAKHTVATMALNLAYLLGCERVFLYGLDLKMGPKGEKHFHPDHPIKNPNEDSFYYMRDALDKVKRDLIKEQVMVYNVNMDSGYRGFPRIDHETAQFKIRNSHRYANMHRGS